jgi:alpha-amylase
MTLRPLLAPLTGVVVALAGTLVPWGESAKADVILHAFAWSYADVAAKADAIAAAGYKAVLLSPPLKSDKTSGCPWWRRYQPQDFRIIDNCDGNKESFQAAIAALQARGVLAYADVVVNHMANERNGATAFPGQAALARYASNVADWRKQILYGDADANGSHPILPARECAQTIPCVC